MFAPPFEIEQWHEVDSSMIYAVGTKNDYLVVQFKNGDIYRYPGLAYEFNNLLVAPSVGRYFHENIRNESCERLMQNQWPDN